MNISADITSSVVEPVHFGQLMKMQAQAPYLQFKKFCFKFFYFFISLPALPGLFSSFPALPGLFSSLSALPGLFSFPERYEFFPLLFTWRVRLVYCMIDPSLCFISFLLIRFYRRTGLVLELEPEPPFYSSSGSSQKSRLRRHKTDHEEKTGIDLYTGPVVRVVHCPAVSTLLSFSRWHGYHGSLQSTQKRSKKYPY